MATPTTQLRSLYRRLLRELPARTPSILANPSALQKRIRADFSSATPSSISPTTSPSSSSPPHPHDQTLPHIRIHEAEQYVHYLRAQRLYTTLVERYNPGMNMSEEDRVRLTARRVGMDLPVEAPAQDPGRGSREGN